MQALSLDACEREHAEYIDTGLRLQAAKLRAKVQAYCENNALELPAWVVQVGSEPSNDVAAPRKHKRNPKVLEKREGHHAVLMAAGNQHDAAQLRAVTRKWCAEAGFPVPEWATLQAPPKAAREPLAPAELSEALQEWQSAAIGRTVSIASDGKVTLTRETEKGTMQATFPSMAAAVESPPRWQRAKPVLPRAEPLELPRELREWRAASGDRVISIASDGSVTLFRVTLDGRQQASFPSLAAAAEACEPPIPWRAVFRDGPRWGHHAARPANASG